MTTVTTVSNGETDGTAAAAELKLAPPSQEWVIASQIDYDYRVQRPEEPAKLARLTAEFDESALGIVSLSRRSDDRLICLDGQHRSKAALANAYEGDILANVWSDLTLAQEARLFRLLNNTSKVNALALYNAAVSEGVPKALAIKAILDRHDLRMVPGLTGGLAAVRTIEAIMDLTDGPEALDWALGVMIAVWGRSGDHLDGRLVEGLARLWIKRRNQFDTARLQRKLSEVPEGIHALLGDAQTYKRIHGGRIHQAMAYALVQAYNTGRGGGKMEAWK